MPWWQEPTNTELCYYYIKKLAANTWYSSSYELLHKAVSCTYKTSLCGSTRNLPFWVPSVDLNKYLVQYRWLTKLRHYVCMYVYTYTLYSYINTYILIVLCFTLNHETTCTIICRWVENCSARSCLRFAYKGKATIATPEVNTFKIVSYICKDIFVCLRI